MKYVFPALLLAATIAGSPFANAQTTVPLHATQPAEASPASALALPRPDPMANASAALANGGNPAAAIGAAHAAAQTSVNQAPSIAGRAGTVGVNGDTGNAMAASSANGVDTVGTPNTESIGMRRARREAAGLEEPARVVPPRP